MKKLTLIGVVGNDATTVTIKDKSYAKFSVAVKEGEATEWVSCLKSDPAGKLVSYIKKGTKLYLEGRDSLSVYKDEAQRTLWVAELEFLNSVKTEQKAEISADKEDDLPF